MPPKEKKTKAQILAAASSGGKSKKKGKQKDKLNNAVYFDKSTYDRLMNDTPKMKMITPYTVSERLKINVSLARMAIKYLEDQKLIIPSGPQNHAQKIYVPATVKAAAN